MTSLSVTCQVKGEDWQDGVLSLRMAWVVEPPVVEFSMVRITPLLLELAKGVAAEKGYWFSSIVAHNALQAGPGPGWATLTVACEPMIKA